MGSSISPLEVLNYLNGLGYKNISADQLKEFVLDLKKLIKYDLKKHSESNESVSSSLESTSGVVPHHLLHTASSLAKQRESKEWKVSIKLGKQAQSCPCVKPKLHINEVSCSNPSSSNSSSNSNSNNGDSSSSTSTTTTKEEPPKILIPTKFRDSYKRKCTNLKLKQTTFILPRPPKKILKCDPVELYHKYKRGWKKQNFPGEADHADLRWAVRERLIGQPQFTSEPTDCFCQKYTLPEA